jgi:inner membrane protein
LDSLTQIALGAAIGEATLGRRVGRRAMLWGAALGTLPDLDVFIPMGDAVRDFTYHRSFSHSLFVLAAITPLLVWLILKLHPQTAPQRRGWLWLVFLVLSTHALLDSFTVYGTQLFWPFYPTPISGSTIFIIDPLYTLPLLAGVACALIAARDADWGRRMNLAGLALSSLYLAWTVGAKLHVEEVARESLARQGIESERLLSVPAPFNTLLWRVLVMADDGYYEGFYSLLDRERTLNTTRYPSEPALLAGLEQHWPVRRLQWFTGGFYAVSRRDHAVVMTDLRMGLEPDYIFSFKVGEVSNPHARPSSPEMLPATRNFGRLAWVWERIWSEDALERR